jgi:hypothetical protein
MQYSFRLDYIVLSSSTFIQKVTNALNIENTSEKKGKSESFVTRTLWMHGYARMNLKWTITQFTY